MMAAWDSPKKHTHHFTDVFFQVTHSLFGHIFIAQHMRKRPTKKNLLNLPTLDIKRNPSVQHTAA